MKPTRIIPIGGVQEIGKSTLIIEDQKHIFIIDAGIKFANTALTGIKGIIPDYSYLKDKLNRIAGIFLTHGHEDHMGGIVHLIKQVPIKKIYAPRIAIQYLKLKFEEHRIKSKHEFIEIEKSAVYKFDDCSVDFWSGQHSIPDAFGIRVRTPNGSVMCTGDFRFDYNPIGHAYTDFARLDEIGKDGLTLLLSDSTNAMRPLHSPSENNILTDIEKFMRQAKKKTILTAFASNLTRVKAVIELAARLGKKVATFGRSMVNGVQIGRKLGYIKADDKVFVDKKEINKVDPSKLLILTTGSQGEQLAALSRMSYGKHQSVKIEKDDMIIFSSSPIPGNRMVIELLVNRLSKLGAIIKENMIDGYLHTSGHAYKHEHDKIFQLTKPKYFLPYHGEFRMSVVHGQSAIRNGVKPENVMVPEMGRVYNMVNEVITKSDEFIDYGPIYIDGFKTISVDNNILKERIKLGENGFVNIVLMIDKTKNTIINRPHLISRGSFFVKNSLDLVEEAKKLAHGTTLFFIKNTKNWNVVDLKKLIVNRLENLFYKEKRRKPVIVPTIIFKSEDNEKIFEDTPITFQKASKETAKNTKIKKAKNKKMIQEIKDEIFSNEDENLEDLHANEEDE